MSLKTNILLSDSQIAGDVSLGDAENLVDQGIAFVDRYGYFTLTHQYSSLTDAMQDLRFYRDGTPRSY